MTAQILASNDQDNAKTDSIPRLRAMSSLLSQVENKWSDIQVGRQGKYSIERLESLNHYCKTTSQTRVILVCVLTPLPALLVALALELMPLQQPSDGWTGNWVFWIRITVICIILTYTGMSVLRRLVLALPLTFPKIKVIASGVSAGFTGFAVILAVVVGFPVPFVMLVGGIPNVIIIGAMLVLMFGITPFRSTSPLRPHLKKFRDFLVTHENLVSIYPLVKVLYALVPGKYQGFMMLLLPLWKFGAKKYVGRAMHELEDYVPQIVAFNVDYFNSLFVSVCMFRSGSILVSVLAILVDVLFSLLEFRELRNNGKAIYQLLRDRKNWSNDHQNTEGLLTVLLELVHNPEARSLPSVRLWACEPHPVPSERLDVLKKLEALDVYRSQPHQSPRLSLSPLLRHQTRRISVAPTLSGPVANALDKPPFPPVRPQGKYSEASDSERSKKLITQGLQLLFHCEYLTLVEYIECIIPIVFVVYKSALQQLPNIVNAPGGAEGWHTGAVGSIIVFAMLEIFSFLALMVLLQRKFAFSPLYQLAYVLETQLEFVQIDVFIATLVLLPFELEHFGMDFSLQFDWLRSKAK